MSKRKPIKANSSRGDTAPRPQTRTGSPEEKSADLKLVRDLARLANEYDLKEIEVSPGGGVRVVRSVAERRPGYAASEEILSVSSSPTRIALVPPPKPEATEDPNAFSITSPFVGTFYRSPSPETDPFIEVGQVIRKGQVVCIVEAMKLMNEIEAEADGRLDAILVKNGEHVQYGQPLFRLIKT